MKTDTKIKEIIADKNLIAYCGLYCGACRSFLTNKCPGCKDNIKASWCKIRDCCIENNFQSCADCGKIELMECKKYNTLISKIIGYVLNSDREACITRIKEFGYDDFAIEMTNNKRQTIKRK
jgi:hypothetical protein